MIIRVAVGVIVRGSQVLIALRPKDKHKGGFWEFPGGKVESGESTLEALKRELKEEIGIRFADAEPMTEITWRYPEKIVLLDVLIVRQFEGDPKGNEGQEVKWVNILDLDTYQFPEANASIVDQLLTESQ